MKLKIFCSILAFSTILSFAQEPKRPECIAPAQPGGGFDLTCKLIQVGMLDTKIISTPIRVTYMPGGVGVVAYNTMVNNRSKDGNVVVAFSSGTLLNIATGKHGKYNENDVKWLASAGVDYGMIAVKADSPYKNLEDLIKALQKDPNSISIGAGGSIGGQDWMQTALLAKAINVDVKKIRYVAFEGGGDALTSLLGNHIDVISAGVAELIPQIKTKTIRVLAIFSPKRLPGILADIPTAKELGYEVEWPTLRAYYMGSKVSNEAYNWWLNAFEKFQKTQEYKDQLNQRSLFEFNKNGKDLEDFVKKQTEQYRTLAKEFKLIK
ncbi:tripartite tricarboxylate transporter substrate binding protein [Campylobacter hepaticus]|uniref:Tripartite tricarboxylate transporter substrate binding protein n=1 Tax=Campylobacter hepaticus TaxID=1813019 RepID=A0A6A7JQP3_9BACT|nr:tripartite tricarboxylate transporter substrate-binding protein [Campylobacter hepaticus]AXP09423.1 tripartite tricarboxylate transporter substrate binding protein [Campylobacter hepaticus]MDX2323166.1 tripartite tricarboxylate transporter substrate-binding protein [Campylobacter hepaticus]MDX2331014.1 tripartite tricarboxylate transporter substrate-binding protein [Campylobacter hepaticus]MDX2332461.1 tripartite tricarboxylate transporter substrate-binding protein [Campylobacter hepaticus]